MKSKQLFSAIITIVMCFSYLSCINMNIVSNAFSLGDVNDDNTIDSSDASVILSIYADYSTGKTPDKAQEELSAADVNSDNAVDSTDASTILAYYAYVSTGGIGTIQEFIVQPYQSDTNTFLASTISINIPKAWKHTGTSIYNRTNPAVLSFFENGDFSLILEEVKITEQLSDDEIFNNRYEQFFDEKTCEKVDVFELENIKYTKSYYSDGSDFNIYMFVKNGYMYQFDVTGLSLLPNGENIVINMLKSIIFELTKIDISGSNNFKLLSIEEKQFLIKSITMFSNSFRNDKSISINQCCETIINNDDKVYIYDLSYLSSSNRDTRNTFIFYPETNKNVISSKSYDDTIREYSIKDYNAELLNKAIKDYYEQFI